MPRVGVRVGQGVMKYARNLGSGGYPGPWRTRVQGTGMSVILSNHYRSYKREYTPGHAIVRAGNPSSGQAFGRILIGKGAKSAVRPAEGRPDVRFRCLPYWYPAAIRLGKLISGPESLSHNIGHVHLCGLGNPP